MSSKFPSTWKTSKLNSIATIQTGLAVNNGVERDNPVTLPYLRVANVQDGHLDLNEIKYITVGRTQAARFTLQAGDVLMTEGGDFDKLGRGAVWDGQISPCLHQNHVFAVRPNNSEITSTYLALFCESALGKRYFLSCSKQTTNLASINSTQLKEMPITFPSLPEQERILAVLDSWDQAIEQTERLIAVKRRRLAFVRKVLFSDLADAQTELGELASVATGVPAPQDKDAFAPKGTRFVRVSDLAAFVGEKTDEPEFLTDVASNGIRLFEAGTIIFAKSGMSAQLSRVVRLPGPAHLVSHMGAVTAKIPAMQSYLYHWLVENPPSSLLQGDGFPSIRISEVAQLPVPALHENHAAEIGAALDSLESEIGIFVRQLDRLRTQKRGLMQKLLTGEWQLDERFDPPKITMKGKA